MACGRTTMLGLCCCLVWAAACHALPQMPLAMSKSDRSELSHWARSVKVEFLKDASADKAHDWTLVMGNQAGDTDSMVSSLAWAWQLSHSPKPVKAVALLQTAYDAIDLRPENGMALEHARMAPLHGDMLSVDELPVKTWDMHHRIKGVVLVDHNVLEEAFGSTTVLSIMDHHVDRNQSMKASPRVIKMVGSCSSLVTLEMRRQREEAQKASKAKITPLPEELADLLLHTIAIDTKGAKKKKLEAEDKEALEWLWPASSWRSEKYEHRMKKIYQHMLAAQDDLSSLSIRDLLRRDFKGGPIKTVAKQYSTLTVGYANVPVGMDEMIARTPEGTSEEWFAVARAWTAETRQDVSIVQTKYKDSNGEKKRELAFLVARGWGGRMDLRAADSLFSHIKNEFEKSPQFNLTVWIRPDGKPLLPRRAVWNYHDGSGRKLVRPFVEAAVRSWGGPTGSE